MWLTAPLRELWANGCSFDLIFEYASLAPRRRPVRPLRFEMPHARAYQRKQARRRTRRRRSAYQRSAEAGAAPAQPATVAGAEMATQVTTGAQANPTAADGTRISSAAAARSRRRWRHRYSHACA